MREASAIGVLKISPAALHLFLLALLCAAAVCGPRRVLAQATGQVSGLVSDPGGQMVAGVRIVLTNVGTAEMRTTATGQEGTYVFPLVNPGMYRVKAISTGFKATMVDRVEVLVNGTSRVDIHLAVGGVIEEVTVTSAS
ncbi:MAG TPA: carboxypeptidase-like regulatory domain-containing protein, partial [Edaphobacter sp.]|nr:carboxypeptidase-like regulatory domain-containing protein [Edaphobacter sp.]